jgi:hypothetical protein
MHSFSAHASPDAVLLFKHHPLDPYDDYKSFIAVEARRLGLQGRVMYCVNGHLPTILDNCTGVITINSTVGFSALLHRRPLCVRGAAIYNLDGLVTRDIDEFMKNPLSFAPDQGLCDGFRNFLQATNQAAGNFHRVLFKGTKTGLMWPQETKFEKHLEKCSKQAIADRPPEPDFPSRGIHEACNQLHSPWDGAVQQNYGSFSVAAQYPDQDTRAGHVRYARPYLPEIP